MQETNYPCWVCGKPLMAVSHAVGVFAGNRIKLHIACQPGLVRMINEYRQPSGFRDRGFDPEVGFTSVDQH
jgi:hypothetical protein